MSCCCVARYKSYFGFSLGWTPDTWQAVILLSKVAWICFPLSSTSKEDGRREQNGWVWEEFSQQVHCHPQLLTPCPPRVATREHSVPGAWTWLRTEVWIMPEKPKVQERQVVRWSDAAQYWVLSTNQRHATGNLWVVSVFLKRGTSKNRNSSAERSWWRLLLGLIVSPS
jgi:hypothetical protein